MDETAWTLVLLNVLRSATKLIRCVCVASNELGKFVLLCLGSEELMAERKYESPTSIFVIS